ncbi:MAG: PIN domain-containing protein [Cyanobacteria bacterium J06560_6]
MNRVFVDTAAWLALLNADDVWHEKACAVRSNLTRTSCTFVTTDFVLLEVADALCAPRCRKSTADFLEQVYLIKSIQVIALSQELFQKGLKLYAQRVDKDWGLTDCISFVVMQQQKLLTAFTSDKHFEQAELPAY